MHIPRLYLATDLSEDQLMILEGKQAHRIAHVLRLKANDGVFLFNGKGGEYQGRLLAFQKNQVSVHIESYVDRTCESPVFLHLAQGISHNEHMDYALQKATELGVCAITPMITDRSFKTKDYKKRSQHWQNVIISAAEQCGRTCLPLLSSPLLLKESLSLLQAEEKYMLHPEGSPFTQKKVSKVKSVIILVGAEGGFTEKEINLGCEFNFKVVSLGPRILRTETASVVALSLLQARYGDIAKAM